MEDAERQACQEEKALALVGTRVRDVPFALCAAHVAASMAYVDDCHLMAHAVGRDGGVFGGINLVIRPLIVHTLIWSSPFIHSFARSFIWSSPSIR